MSFDVFKKRSAESEHLVLPSGISPRGRLVLSEEPWRSPGDISAADLGRSVNCGIAGRDARHACSGLYSRTNRSRSALPITETELKLIAAAAMMGERSRPNAG